MSNVSDNGYPIEEGKRYARSPITGTLYRVTRWEVRGGERMVALEKEEVDESEAPEELAQ